MDKGIIYYNNFFPSWVKAGRTLKQFGDFKSGNPFEKNSKTRLSQTLKILPQNVVALHQIHQTTIYEVDTNFTVEKKEGDGLVTKNKGKALIIKSADCLPILMVETQKRIIMALHAGRVGTQALIAKKGIETIKKMEGNPKFIKVIFGPSIERKCYTMDLVLENKKQLISSGVLRENILVDANCTYCSNDLYYSYRRGDAQRFATFVMMI